MAQFCELCGRGPMWTKQRSHSKVATNTKKSVNLQTKRIDGKKVKTCTRCLRTLAKNPNHIQNLGSVERKLTSRTKKSA